jgi:hypothetical protein
MTAQPLLNIQLSQRTVLVDVNSVRAALGIDADSVSAKIDNGELQWVFDVSTSRTKIRELRFWAREVIAPESVAFLSLSKVISQIVPQSRDWFHGSEIAHLLLISRPTLMLLSGELKGEIINHSLRVKRTALEKFLALRCDGPRIARQLEVAS